MEKKKTINFCLVQTAIFSLQNDEKICQWADGLKWNHYAYSLWDPLIVE